MTRSADPPSATGARPRSPGGRATSLHGDSGTRRPGSRPDSHPAASRRSTASVACCTSASGSAPRGSAATMGWPTSCARPHAEHSHICSGWPGQGRGPRIRGNGRTLAGYRGRAPDGPTAHGRSDRRVAQPRGIEGLLSSGDTPGGPPDAASGSDTFRGPEGVSAGGSALSSQMFVLGRIEESCRPSVSAAYAVRASPTHLSTWACRRSARATSRRTRSTNRRSFTRCTCVSAHRASSCSCPHTSPERRSSPTMRTSRRTRTPGWPTPSGSQSQ